MNEKKNFSTIMGRMVAYVFVGSITVCLTAAMVALTARFITWLF